MRAFLVSIMGPWFGPLFDFYEANALWLNLIVIAYGFVIVLAWSNLVRIRNYLVRDLIAQMRRTPDRYAGSDSEPMAAEIQIAWAEAVAATQFPLVAHQSALWPRRTSIESVQALLSVQALVTEAREAMATAR